MTNETPPPSGPPRADPGRDSIANLITAHESALGAHFAQHEKILTDLGPATDGLANSVKNSVNGTHSLVCQAKLLDHMLCAITRGCLNDTMQNGDYTHRWLDFALRIQKQSMDTVKTAAAVEYMQTLTEATHANLHKKLPQPDYNARWRYDTSPSPLPDSGERNIKET